MIRFPVSFVSAVSHTFKIITDTQSAPHQTIVFLTVRVQEFINNGHFFHSLKEYICQLCR